MAEGAEQEDKTEEPSLRKLEQAHEKGDVPKSQEVGAWFVISASALAMGLLAPSAAGSLTTWLRGLIAGSGTFPVDGERLESLWREIGLTMAAVLLLPLGLLFLAGLAGNLIQHRPVWSLEPLKPKGSKISPLAGFKRLFSPESLLNFVKGLLKIAFVSGMMVILLWPEVDQLDTIVATDIAELLPFTLDIAMKLMIAVAAFMAVVAGLDFLWQRQRWLKRQRMSFREIKEEFRQTEGDPLVRAKIRQLRMQRGRRRMMAQVPEASVIITNPTHYAVALKYEDGMPAPRCVAKGVDATAQRIRAIAVENDIPVVENPPLARSLYAQVDLDAVIPEEHYRAVAEIIGYVMRMRRVKRWRPAQ